MIHLRLNLKLKLPRGGRSKLKSFIVIFPTLSNTCKWALGLNEPIEAIFLTGNMHVPLSVLAHEKFGRKLFYGVKTLSTKLYNYTKIPILQLQQFKEQVMSKCAIILTRANASALHTILSIQYHSNKTQ